MFGLNAIQGILGWMRVFLTEVGRETVRPNVLIRTVWSAQ